MPVKKPGKHLLEHRHEHSHDHRELAFTNDAELRVTAMSTNQSPLILLVDDDPIQRILLRASLEPFGFKCEEAEDGKDGIDKCATLSPDLVILDVMMPGTDGFGVCSEIRQNSDLHTTPVLMMTALNDIQSIERAFDVGATNFQTKPINTQLLPYHLKYMLRSSSFEQKSREAQRLAEESSAAKSHFLANMSHELRTPLNAVLGFSEVIYQQILGEVGNSTYLEYAKDIHESAAHLLNLINDILDISKVESGNIDLDMQVCNLPELIERVARIARPLAEEAALQFDVRIADDMPHVLTDELRLKQVLINLLSNAIKFTPATGRITVKVGLDRDQRVIISVADSGIGIPANEVQNMLSPFAQVDSDLNRKYEGTGLGLPIAKSLTEQMGGSFQLESAEGRGTCAIITFPSDDQSEVPSKESYRLAS